MARKGQKFKKYSLDLRLKIVNEKITKGKSYSCLSTKYKVSEGTIKTWVHQFKKNRALDIKQKGRPKRDNNTDYKEKYEILKKYLEFLEEVEQGKK